MESLMKNSRSILVPFLVFFSLFLTSCGSGKEKSKPEVSNLPSATLPKVNISVTPSVIRPGEPATLRWEAKDADSVALAENGGVMLAVPTEHSQVVSVNVTTTYTVVARKGEKEEIAATTLVVAEEPSPHHDPPSDPDPMPQDTCMEDPGVMVAGRDHLLHGSGMGSLRVFGENKTFLVYTEINPEDKYSTLKFCERGVGEPAFSCTTLAEYARGTLGGIPYVYEVGNDGSIYIVWWRMGATIPPLETKAFFVSRLIGSNAWSEPVELSYPYSIPRGTLSSFRISGTTLYLFDQPDFSTKEIIMLKSEDQGRHWSQPQVVYRREDAGVSLARVFINHEGKLFLLFGENRYDPEQRLLSLITSSDRGETWSSPPLQIELPVNTDGVFDTVMTPSGIFYQLTEFGAPLKLRRSADFLTWEEVGAIPTTNMVRYSTQIRLHISDAGFTLLDFSPFCSTSDGKTLRSIMMTRSSDGTTGSWSAPVRLQTLGITNTSKDMIGPSFSSAVTSSGKVKTLWPIFYGASEVDGPSDEFWFMQEP